MSKIKPSPAVISGVNITSRGAFPAIDCNSNTNTMTLNSQATIRMGSIELTEAKFAKMDAMLEFVERFVQEDERARAIWIAIKAKKRILT
jgi:hypothetical protein